MGLRGCRRAGFTLVELLVALLVFDVALLAFAADAAALIRLRGTEARRALSIAAAESRIATLRAAGCPAASGGQALVAPGVRESWRIDAPTESSRRVRDSVAFGSPVAPAAFVLTSVIGC